ncbi:MAG: SEL1-like repeat protein [Asticcacaulis sp.]
MVKHAYVLHISTLLFFATASFSQAQSLTAAGPDLTTVTIYGKRLDNLDKRTTTIPPNRASSCNFIGSTGGGDYEFTQNYLNGFGHVDYDNRISIFSPYGDASREHYLSPFDNHRDAGSLSSPNLLSSGTSGCTSGHRALAAGRAYIQRRDKSLQQALTAYDAGNYPEAINQFKIAWNKIGYPDSALFLGHIYILGQGTEVDIPEGIKWLKRAANQPYQNLSFDPAYPDRSMPRIDAALTLGSIYLTGYGVPQDKKEAVHWYKKAADTGHAPSTVILATLYQNGIGVEQDLKKAASLYKKAAEAGYGAAQYNLARLYETGNGVEQNPALALEWDSHAAQSGHAGALYEMAVRYDRGKDGLSVDSDKALIYYKDAALKNQIDAQNALGVSFYAGDGVEADQPTARQWFQQAALRGQPDAMFNLGVMLMNGEGGNVDNAMAYVWFNLAKQSGHENADAALKAMEPKLTVEDRAKAQNLLNPQA